MSANQHANERQSVRRAMAERPPSLLAAAAFHFGRYLAEYLTGMHIH